MAKAVGKSGKGKAGKHFAHESGRTYRRVLGAMQPMDCKFQRSGITAITGHLGTISFVTC